MIIKINAKENKKVYIINNINILRRINKKKKKEYVFVPDKKELIRVANYRNIKY